MWVPGTRSHQLAALSRVRSAPINVPVSGVGARPTMSMSDSVLIINLAQVCQGLAEQGARAKKDCLDTEQQVRNELVKVWRSFDTADQTHCATESRMGGESSYTELITCLEMASAVRKLHEEADAARHPQTIGQR